jgi:hypothetical protein
MKTPKSAKRPEDSGSLADFFVRPELSQFFAKKSDSYVKW